MNPNAAIHVAKTQLGLDDDSYRDILYRVTGVRSSAVMTPAQRSAVLTEFRKMGYEPTPPAGRERKSRPSVFGAMRLEGPYVGKMRALWITGYHLGVVHDRTDAALVAFVRRQTGIDHASWVRDPADAAKVIEAVKAWLAREAGVQWPGRAPPQYATFRAVIAAQLTILGLPPEGATAPVDFNAYIADLGAQIRKLKS